MPTLQDVKIIDIPSGNCAVCRNEDGLVVNTIVAEPNDPTPRPGFYLIGIELNTPVTNGCRWDGTKFLDPQGNVLSPIVPETRCAVVDPNSYVIELALAQIDAPFVYEGNTLIPIPDGQLVGVGFYWDGSEFLLPENNIKVVLELDKSEKTAEFVNKVIKGQIDSQSELPIPYGFATDLTIGETSDTMQVINVLNTFNLGQKISDTLSFENCPTIIDVKQE